VFGSANRVQSSERAGFASANWALSFLRIKRLIYPLACGAFVTVELRARLAVVSDVLEIELSFASTLLCIDGIHDKLFYLMMSG
jgi:hypothetical protein